MLQFHTEKTVSLKGFKFQTQHFKRFRLLVYDIRRLVLYQTITDV